MRKPIVAANWKMNKPIGEAIELAAEVKRGLAGYDGAEVVLCPPFTALKSVGDLLRYSGVKLGAQNMHWAEGGAYTGEVSASMLVDLGCEFVILGHSERRVHCAETNEDVQRKLKLALKKNLTPIVCVGESEEQRAEGRAEEVVQEQLEGSLGDLGEELERAVLAYEPVWAIGTGRAATPDEAQAAHAFVRKVMRARAGESVAESIRILYGGSVKPSNARELFQLPDVDGGLIGGASLDPSAYLEILNAV